MLTHNRMIGGLGLSNTDRVDAHFTVLNPAIPRGFPPSRAGFASGRFRLGETGRERFAGQALHDRPPAFADRRRGRIPLSLLDSLI